MMQLRHMYKANTVPPVISSIPAIRFQSWSSPCLGFVCVPQLLQHHRKVLETAPGTKNPSTTFAS